jgi:hypothetical protein
MGSRRAAARSNRRLAALVKALVAGRVRRVTSASLIGLQLIGLQRRIKQDEFALGNLRRSFASMCHYSVKKK